MRHRAQQLCRALLHLSIGLDVVRLADDLTSAEMRVEVLKNELAALRKQMQPAAGTVMRWREAGRS